MISWGTVVAAFLVGVGVGVCGLAVFAIWYNGQRRGPVARRR